MRTKHLILPVLTGSLLLAAIACSESDSGGTNNNSTGGTTATGGTTTTGGTTATGGTTGTGGGGADTESVYKTAVEAGLDLGLGAYDYVDAGGSSVTLTVDGTGKLCGTGTAAATGEGLYDTIWGGGIAVQLVDLVADPAAPPFDASAYDGFSFTLTGKPAGELRIGVTTVDDPNNAFFSTTAIDGENTLLWSDRAQGSWVTAPATFDAAKLKDIQFQVASGTAPVTFEFCVSNIQWVGDGGMGGAGGGGNP